MGAVDDAEDDDAPHFHFLKKAGIEAADSGKMRAVLAECWRASSINISDGNNKKKPRTIEFIHHNTCLHQRNSPRAQSRGRWHDG